MVDSLYPVPEANVGTPRNSSKLSFGPHYYLSTSFAQTLYPLYILLSKNGAGQFYEPRNLFKGFKVKEAFRSMYSKSPITLIHVWIWQTSLSIWQTSLSIWKDAQMNWWCNGHTSVYQWHQRSHWQAYYDGRRLWGGQNSRSDAA